MKNLGLIPILMLACLAWAEGGSENASPLSPLLTPFDLDFSGGTVSELLGEVEAQSGKQPNVIADPGVAELTVPAMNLRGVSTWSLLKGLEQVMEGKGNCRLVIRVSTPYPSQHDAIVTMSCIPTNEKIADMPTRPLLFVISDLLEEYQLEDIHTAISTAIEMAYGEDSKPVLKFHKETKLLLAKCDRPEEVEIVVTVLKELRSSMKSRNKGSK